MRGGQRGNVMRFAVVIPSDNFNEAWLEVQHLNPSLIPEIIGWEDPVFAIWDFGTKVGGEPRRDG